MCFKPLFLTGFLPWDLLFYWSVWSRAFRRVFRLKPRLQPRLLVLLFLLLSTRTIFAQENSQPPLEAQLTIDHTALKLNETTQAALLLRNTTPYTLTGVSVELQGSVFNITTSTQLPDTLPPYGSTQANYTLQSEVAGSHNATFIVQYSWSDPDTQVVHQWLEIASVQEVEVIDPWAFDWPDSFTLLIGLIVGQILAWLNNRWQQYREESQREEQARGVMLAILQAVRRGVEAKEQISFSMWEEAIVKGNLYPALHRLGRTIGKPELSKRLAELSITLADYNERQAKENLTDNITNVLINELVDLIRIIENRS